MLQNYAGKAIKQEALKSRAAHPFSALCSNFCKFNILEFVAWDNSFQVTDLVSECLCQQVTANVSDIKEIMPRDWVVQCRFLCHIAGVNLTVTFLAYFFLWNW